MDTPIRISINDKNIFFIKFYHPFFGAAFFAFFFACLSSVSFMQIIKTAEMTTILFAVILVVAVGIIIAVTSHQKKEMDFDEFADRFEKSAEEVLGEDVKKVSKTELAATLTYGDQNDKDNNIYYRILKTSFYEGNPAEIHGLHTEALKVLFPVDSMDSCEEMMIQDWPGALYKKDDTAFLCWTYSPEVTYVLEYTPSKIDDSEIIKMAESAEVEK